MIIIRFDAGLGNQMLQYANYLALQQRYPDTQVVADISKYNFSKIHNGLELEDIFPIHLKIKIGKRTKNISPIGKYFYFTFQKAVTLFFKTGILKTRFVTDSGLLNWDLFQLDPARNYYLDGRWGNEKYFENVKEVLQSHFTFKTKLDLRNETISEEIKTTNSVGVHIRRGDYIHNNSSFFDLSTSNYYPEAFEYFSKLINDPVFYIFSDDSEWCSNNLIWLKKYKHRFIGGNKGKENYKDLQLMSLCKHVVIANSTFSWWGGWLNNNLGKTVICPQKLFYDEEKNTQILSQFYPARWVKL